jgi:dTDP-4-dehydrorhamnose 3,5-epimerase-like enzyme
MNYIRLEEITNGPRIFVRKRHADSRGSFEMAIEIELIKVFFPNIPNLHQVNILTNKKGSLRGFHGSAESENHWKVVTTISGSVREAFLDIRKKSNTYGKVSFIDLDHNSNSTLVIPPGFAHGVQSRKDNTIIMYATNISYKSNKEQFFHPISSIWEDLWEKPMIISEKDSNANVFSFSAKEQL